MNKKYLPTETTHRRIAVALESLADNYGEAGSGGGNIDSESTVAFTIGYDENGFYVNTQDEEETETETTETEEQNG